MADDAIPPIIYDTNPRRAPSAKAAYCGRASELEIPEGPVLSNDLLMLALRERDIQIAALEAKLRGLRSAMVAVARMVEPYVRHTNGYR